MDRGKVLTAKDLERIGKFARYEDVDGDGITYRTLPGTDHPLAAYFNRGTGHDLTANYSERPEDWEENLKRIWRKLETARSFVPKPVLRNVPGARIGLIAYGSTDVALREAQDLLADGGLTADYLRVRSVPFSKDVAAFVEGHERVYVIELNIDGQMRQLLQLECPEQAGRIRSLCRSDGLPLAASQVVAWVREAEAE